MLDCVALRCVGISVRLREITGDDERALGGTSTAAAIALLDRLLAPGGPAAADLPAADRDRLLAALQRRTFGDRVQATVACAACDEPFDLDFALSALERELDEQADRAAPGPERDGAFRVAGARVRPPSGSDELELATLGRADAAAALLERCAGEPGRPVGIDELDELLERVAPLLDLDLDATCPACGTPQPVHFDVQSFCLGSVLAERPRLLADVHVLATSYRWSARDILALARADRRALVALVEG